MRNPELVRNLELEAAIAAAPEALERYAAYAAWLRENGDPWGELIAAQLAAEEEPPRKRRLKAAARAALERYMAARHPGVTFHLPESPLPEEQLRRITWRRGFVEALELRGLAQPLLDQGLAFARAREAVLLRRLDLAFTPLAELPDLSALAQLEQLSLDSTRLRDLGPLGPLRALGRLRVLGLAFTGVTDLAPLAGLEALESLNLMGTGVVELAPLRGLKRLRELILLKTAVSDEQVEALQAALPALRRRGGIER